MSGRITESPTKDAKSWAIRPWAWILEAQKPLTRILPSSAPIANHKNPPGKIRWVQNAMCLTITISSRFRCVERHAPARRLDLIFRAYNEGVAFRYFLPKQDGLDLFVISAENTGFYFNQDASAYALRLNCFNTAYEGHFDHVHLDQIKPESIVGLPLLVEIPHGPWVGLLEADLTDYAGMYVGGVAGAPNALISKLAPVPSYDPAAMGTYVDAVRLEDELGKTVRLVQQKLLLSPPGKGQQLLSPLASWGYGPGSEDIVVGKTPKATPWRVLLINSRPGGLIESNYLVLNLSHPSVLPDTSWIQPGKAAWDWWSGRLAKNVNFEPGMNTATMMHYIDFAAEHHIEYILIDSNWSPVQRYHPDSSGNRYARDYRAWPEQGCQSAPLDDVDRRAGAG